MPKSKLVAPNSHPLAPAQVPVEMAMGVAKRMLVVRGLWRKVDDAVRTRDAVLRARQDTLALKP